MYTKEQVLGILLKINVGVQVYVTVQAELEKIKQPAEEKTQSPEISRSNPASTE